MNFIKLVEQHKQEDLERNREKIKHLNQLY